MYIHIISATKLPLNTLVFFSNKFKCKVEDWQIIRKQEELISTLLTDKQNKTNQRKTNKNMRCVCSSCLSAQCAFYCPLSFHQASTVTRGFAPYQFAPTTTSSPPQALLCMILLMLKLSLDLALFTTFNSASYYCEQKDFN